MKTKIFLPVLAMLSLMLFSFTTNTNAESSVRQLADGNYALQSVQLDEGQAYEIDRLVERISVYDRLNDDTAARGSWIWRNQTWDDNHFTQKTIGGRDFVAQLDEGDTQIVNEARERIGDLMSRYMR